MIACFFANRPQIRNVGNKLLHNFLTRLLPLEFQFLCVLLELSERLDLDLFASHKHALLLVLHLTIHIVASSLSTGLHAYHFREPPSRQCTERARECCSPSHLRQPWSGAFPWQQPPSSELYPFLPSRCCTTVRLTDIDYSSRSQNAVDTQLNTILHGTK